MGKQTLEICEKGFYISPRGAVCRIAEMLNEAVSGTRLYCPSDELTVVTDSHFATVFEVSSTASWEAYSLFHGARLLRFRSYRFR